MNNIDKEKKNKQFISILIITLASTSITVSSMLLINNIGLYAGGVTGISQIILHFISISMGHSWNYLDNYIWLINFILLLPFNILAFFKLSKKYAIYTFISSCIQTVAFFLCTNMNIKLFDGDVLPNLIIGATINGLCNGLLMRRGATSGGFITLSQYLNIKKGKSVGSINLIVCSIIMLCGAIISGLQSPSFALDQGISTALYTLLYFILESLVLDFVHTSYNKIKVEVVTEIGDIMCDRLLKELSHGITIINAKGAYTLRDKKVLNITIQTYEYNYYYKMIKEIDPNAFITVTPLVRLSGNFKALLIDK